MNPSGLCKCGCGQKAKISPRNDKRWGYVKGEPRDFIHNHHARGSRNIMYKGGLSFHKGMNRWRIVCRDGSTVLYARAVMEAHLRRHLNPEEEVHHKNEDSSDDRYENLELYKSKSDHRKHGHGDSKIPKQRYTTEELVQKLREFSRHLGRVPTVYDIKRDPSMPGVTVYYKRFNGYKNALKVAGLDGN